MTLDMLTADAPVVGVEAMAAPCSRMHQVFEIPCAVDPTRVAIDHDAGIVTYGELDMRANQLAQHLHRRGVRAGARVAVFLHRSLSTYVSLLAVGKAGATLVPIDPAAPQDRVAYILGDASVDAVVTSSDLSAAVAGSACVVVELDAEAVAIADSPATPPVLAPPAPDEVAYVMYTSGSSGRPKGVMVTHASICNFLSVVPEVYDVRPDDRVYQGMTISFDFSIEEIWPTWARGATLVVGPTDSRRLGAELADFLEERSVTVLYCVPTLLATLPRVLPGIRSVLVGGEACPSQLVARWACPGRRMLNTYGPTEATVTATVGELVPGRAVTIGRPLPTYTVVLLDEQRRAVPDGEIGEICIGGPGVAAGYVGRPDLTADRFIDHELAPLGSRLYRTGDLGRVDTNGEIEYHGRADAEVKIRGHRIDLGEVESVLLEDPTVAEAVVTAVPTEDGAASEALAAYVVRGPEIDTDEELANRLHEQMRRRLPPYMVAATVDVVPELPTMPSGKVDRKRLPAPAGYRFTGTGPIVAAETDTEKRVVAAWAQTLGVPAESLSVEADFFRELGGHSLLAARAVSRLRDGGFVSVALRDLYEHPSVRALSKHLSNATAAVADTTRQRPVRHPTRLVAAAGCVQAVVLYLLLFVITVPVAYIYTINDGFVSVGVLVQLMAAILITYVAVRWILPLLFVRLLTAGIRSGRYPLWGLTYLRIWTANLLLEVGPLPVLSGSPLLPGYLRLLGARIGRGVHLGSSELAMPSKLRIGDGASVGYGATLRPWRVQDGWVLVAPITVGEGAFVGAHAVLDPGSTVEAGAALGEQSMLVEGEKVPTGDRWAGSPAASVRGTLAGRGRSAGNRAEPRAVDRGAARRGRRRRGRPGTCGHRDDRSQCRDGVGGPAAVGNSRRIARHPACRTDLRPHRVPDRRGRQTVHPPRAFRRLVPGSLRTRCPQMGLRQTARDQPHLHQLALRHPLHGAVAADAGSQDREGRRDLHRRASGPGLARARRGDLHRGHGQRRSRHFRQWIRRVPTDSGRPSIVHRQRRGRPGRSVDRRQLPGRRRHRAPDRRRPAGDGVAGITGDEPAGPAGQRQLRRERNLLPAATAGETPTRYRIRPSDPARVAARGQHLPVPVGAVGTCARARPAAAGPAVAADRRRVRGRGDRLLRSGKAQSHRHLPAAGGTAVEQVRPTLGARHRPLRGAPRCPSGWAYSSAHHCCRRCCAGSAPASGGAPGSGTTYLTEFDLVDIGDDAAIGLAASLQTHLFEDRVMKMSTVTVGAGASVGTRAIVLYDSVVDPDVALDSLSLLMKGEHLARGTRWGGIPAQHYPGTAPAAPVGPPTSATSDATGSRRRLKARTPSRCEPDHFAGQKGQMVNTNLLVSDTRHYRIDYEINPYMSTGLQPDPRRAATEHDSIVDSHRAAGRAVEYLPSAPECPDMVFTANTAVVAR